MSVKRNRPEVGVDGNWACPRCTNVNFGTRTECNLCKTQPDGNWLCKGPGCTNMNYPHREECNRCKTPRPAGGSAARSGSAGGAGGGYGAGMSMMGGGGYGGGGYPQMGAPSGAYSLGMQLVAMFPTAPDPFSAAASFVASLGAPQGMGMGMPMGGGFQQKRPRTAPRVGEKGNWACPSCSNVNFEFRDACNKCQAPKE